MSRYVIIAPAIMTAIEYRSGIYGSLFCTTAGSYSANALPPQTLYASINTEFFGVGIVQLFKKMRSKHPPQKPQDTAPQTPDESESDESDSEDDVF